MVHPKTSQREALKQLKKDRLTFFLVVLAVLILFESMIVITVAVGRANGGNSSNSGQMAGVDDGTLVPSVDGGPDADDDSGETQDSGNDESVLPERIDFQPVVESWVGRTGGRKSVLLYDLDRDEVVGEYLADDSHSTASIYKLFIVYEGYLRVQSHEWNADDPCGVTGHTILECLDLAIRASESTCAETLWGMIGRSLLDELVVSKYGMTSTTVSQLVSTPRDVAKMLEVYYEHTELSDDALIERMKDSFLNQPSTIYNWRQGLPSGFTRANVYNKVGWDFNPDGNYWNLYHDAAIVTFPEPARNYIVVVMSERVPFQSIRTFGSEFENYFYDHVFQT